MIIEADGDVPIHTMNFNSIIYFIKQNTEEQQKQALIEYAKQKYGDNTLVNFYDEDTVREIIELGIKTYISKQKKGELKQNK